MAGIFNWKEFLYPYKQAVDELVLKFESIIEEYKLLGLYCPMDSVKGRVKKPHSILEKAERKHIPDDRIEDEIEDIAGIRILCEFVDDIYKIVDFVHDRDGVDLKIVEERDYIANMKSSGYRSYHIIIKYPIVTARGLREIFAEIQIRTLAMNFWATAEHSLKYKYNGNLPEDLQERLKRSAEAAFTLDTEMGMLRDDIMMAQRLNERKENLTISIIDNIKKLYASDKVYDMAKLDEDFIEATRGGDLAKMEAFNEELMDIIRD